MFEIRVVDLYIDSEKEKLRNIEDLYYIIRFGNIPYIENRKYKIPKIINPYIKNHKKNLYPCVKLSTKLRNKKGEKISVEIRFHTIVGRAFIPNPNPNLFNQVGHLDENKNNYSINNLKWMTGSRNIKQMISDKKIINNQVDIFGKVCKKDIKKIELQTNKCFKNQLSLFDYIATL